MTLSRSQLLYLLIAQALVIIPQLSRLPGIAVLGWGLIVLWYAQIWRGRWQIPSAFIKALLVLACIGGVAWHYQGFMALEAQMAVVICGLCLKLLELKQRRDVWMLLAIAYFLVAGQLLFEQQMVWLLIVAVQLLALLIVQQAMFSQLGGFKAALKRACFLVLSSLPILVFLFLLFPRMGPLWNMPLPGSKAVTGLSDDMAPGDVAALSRSGALAFRVEFDEAIPPAYQLYWRGLVLEYFDGRRWSRNPTRAEPWQWPRPTEQAINYSLTLQPGVHAWLPALPGSHLRRNDVTRDRRGQWLPDQPLTGRLRYEARVVLGSDSAHGALSAHERRLNTYLPASYNPQAQVLGRLWRELEDSRQRVAVALRWWQQQNLVYTLQPPLLGKHSVDEFLFDSQRGFCEHFASAMAVLLRAADVPARIVLGYQGGERNPLNSTLLVHQSDAHAWLEYWLPEQGWLRLDPTALLVPSRIEQGADQVLSTQEAYLSGSGFNWRRFQWANQMRFWVDSLEYNWARWVLNFDQDDQWEMLRYWDSWSGFKWYHWFVASLLLSVLAFAYWWRGFRRQDPLDAAYQQLISPLSAQGLVRRTGETPRAFANRVALAMPAYSDWIFEITAKYETAKHQAISEQERQALLKDLRKERFGKAYRQNMIKHSFLKMFK